MLSKSHLLFFLVFIINSYSAQNSNTQNELIICAAKNQVAEDVMVYTFIYKNEMPTNEIGDTDAFNNSPNSLINSILQKFSGVFGVSECSFDAATRTFTVVTTSSIDLSNIVYEINHIEP
jgi:hypothetical protein